MSAEPIPFDGGKPYITIVVVDPATAERWLGKNAKNRRVRPDHVTFLAGQMSTGKWQLTGEAIKFAPDGTLLDGQHRLHAIVQSGATIPVFVARNIPAPARDVMDTGSARGAGDMLALHEIPNSQHLAAAARWAILFDSGRLVGERLPKVAHPEILDYVYRWPLLQQVGAEAGIRRALDMPPAVATCAMFLTGRVDADAAQEFWGQIASGVGIPPGSPILALTSRLREIRKNRQRVTPAAYLSMCIRTWNAWRQNKTVMRLQVYGRDGTVIPCPQPK